MRAVLLLCAAARAACGETGSGGVGSSTTASNYTDGRGCTQIKAGLYEVRHIKAGLYEVPQPVHEVLQPDRGCCLGERDDWCHNNYEKGFTCGFNACGEMDCCIPEPPA